MKREKPSIIRRLSRSTSTSSFLSTAAWGVPLSRSLALLVDGAPPRGACSMKRAFGARTKRLPGVPLATRSRFKSFSHPHVHRLDRRTVFCCSLIIASPDFMMPPATL